MMISTKGRYALRVMIDLAQNGDENFVSLKDVAERQNISMKYLEMIVSMLNKGNMVRSQRGKTGGYKLAKTPSEYTVGEILKLTEGTLAPVMCLEEGAEACERAKDCVTLPLWKELNHIIDKYLDSVTLDDVINKRI
ncbi:MAG: RrF2 family transcriptional regulator [Eubacterium sp.]|jgi:Rrf2 family protein|nr:RrF2 family transcriptional regulator [Eubacterium sp.]